ncbi:hypothetical protein SAM40697_0226 [Streptomyces ambofaciens]|uniref:Uncharacterized protein n=1 Tax=Streptomyces ambofaciens TaxID=1889 RepID=A0ABN4NZM4_STRAM|nr:hypothetical protein SAM40697_0226 [Streptomyces ambofaciens]
MRATSTLAAPRSAWMSRPFSLGWAYHGIGWSKRLSWESSSRPPMPRLAPSHAVLLPMWL